MTPSARYAAAIAVLDVILGGEPAERALTNWARRNRYAGSKDRAAVRGHVFDVLRKKRSCAAFGAGGDGRALVLGLLRQTGIDPLSIFSGEGYAPEPLTEDELSFEEPSLSEAEAADLPDWVWPLWRDGLGDKAISAAQSQRERAKVALRVNERLGSVDSALQSLASDEIEAIEHPNVIGCLNAVSNQRRLAQGKAYQTGLVELQDASSQAAVRSWPISTGDRVLDFCAGGGGKSLALAAIFDASVTAHDSVFDRMADIPVRAARARASIKVVKSEDLDTLPLFDVVLCDAPCSGSGTWRRTPDAKWRLTEDELRDFQDRQVSILESASKFLKKGGVLIYSTCSVLQVENGETGARFLNGNPNFERIAEELIVPTSENDGFYHCVYKGIY
ncbi:16S rRNA (cytosine967-C5)-methyltransferase [Cognatiyoonia sediminum]|uniref:16S rRNA (Cytosine967-C5)-methyltransferase n=1 Tax=Cognatiyoonia sediminum TaxID=1508389 RepID=A0A1M5MIN3_9RHOB|nr:RsmB/NOP family class I SAM-dependent RNA methyltransferase [Cognatiyoonia sediminum]SHG77324.1 16S rRNA (cytosine967-C5)-methyltransferase [Cognatiyoonia sediminum]